MDISKRFFEMPPRHRFSSWSWVISFVILINFCSQSLCEENLYSKKILRCNEDCELTELTWENNYGNTNVIKGLFKDETMHYCLTKDSWDPIIRWWNIGSQYHMFAQQLIKGECFQVSEMQDYIAVELVKDKGKLKVYRAEWIYNQPQEFYVLQIIE